MAAPIQTSDYWDGSADTYILSAEPFTAQFCEDAVTLAQVATGMRLLDVATGPGALALAAARAGAIVTAIDFSQAMIDRLSMRIGNLPITAAAMDGQALDLPDAHFDRACCVFGIPLFPDWRAGLRELARVLHPGGRTVVAVADNPHGFGPNQFLARARARLFPAAPAPVDAIAMDLLSDREQLIEAFSTAGFEHVAIHERTHDFVLDGALFVPDHPMILASPVLAGLSDDDRARVIAEAIDEAHHHSSSAALLLPSTARFIVSTKP